MLVLLFVGVEQIKTDIVNSKVTVSGKFDDPVKILQRVQKKFSKNAELISPKPNPKQEQKKEPQQNKEVSLFHFFCVYLFHISKKTLIYTH